MKKITRINQNKWNKFLTTNGGSSYSLVVCLAILIIWEAGAKDKEEAFKILLAQKLGLSGAQAEYAAQMAMSKDANSWIDQEMSRIRRGEIISQPSNPLKV